MFSATLPPEARGRRGRNGSGGDELPGSRGEAGGAGQSMDALKARILEAAPGEVRRIIAHAAVTPR